MIKKIDHAVITTAVPQVCLNFYTKLGFTVHDAGGWYELFAGDFKINVHTKGRELLPHAQTVQTGSADLCFEISGSLAAFQAQLEANGLLVELEPVARSGVNGAMQSIYLRDPDGNLIELCSYE